jgi:Na+/H+ antiporter
MVAFGAEQELQLLLLLVAATVLLVLAGPLRVPYPILLVLGGLVVGFVPGMPTVSMPPEVVLFGILPPLLYLAAYSTGLRELRANLLPISLLAVGLVVATTIGVALVAHALTSLSWPTAFVLGAVVSPTDPVAATAIGRRFGVPRRLLAVIEGESLVNDGSALVLLRVALTVAVAGSFSVAHAGWLLVANIVGGVAVGLGVGYVVRRLRRALDNPPLEILIAFLTGYFAFLPASALGVSGVLATVTAGVYMGWHTPELTTVQTRLQGQGFWEILSFLLNVLLFGLVGLQLRPILSNLSGHSAGVLVADAAAVSAAVIAVRAAWVFTTTAVRRLSPRLRMRALQPPWRSAAFASWSGMRGAVTLAAALLIPLETDTGAPFPGRDLIVFCAFGVVLATLVLQGLTLPLLVRWLRFEDDGGADEEEANARIRAAEAALERIEELAADGSMRTETAARLRRFYRFRIDRFRERLDGDGGGAIEEQSQSYQRAQREVLVAQRHAVVEMRNAGEISDEVMRVVERDLDLEDSRLDI